MGYDIKQHCLDENSLSSTLYAQVALFITSALAFENYKKENNIANVGFCIGHSLGELNALYAAEVFDFATGIKIVQKRAEIMHETKGGAMAAVLGLKNDDVKKILEDQGDTTDIANYNSPGQVVISGTKKNIDHLKEVFTQAGAKRYLPLKVSGAFHSRYMKKSSQEFSSFLENIQFSSIKIPVIANINAKPYLDNSIKENLSSQINNSVKWTQTINYLLKKNYNDFIELGEGKILTGILKRIKG